MPKALRLLGRRHGTQVGVCSYGTVVKTLGRVSLLEVSLGIIGARTGLSLIVDPWLHHLALKAGAHLVV